MGEMRYLHTLEKDQEWWTCTVCRARSLDKTTLGSIPCTNSKEQEPPVPPQAQEEEEAEFFTSPMPPPFPRIGEVWVEVGRQGDPKEIYVWTDYAEEGMDWKNVMTGARRGGQQMLAIREVHPSTKVYVNQYAVAHSEYMPTTETIQRGLLEKLQEGLRNDDAVMVGVPEYQTESLFSGNETHITCTVLGRQIPKAAIKEMYSS